MRCLIRWYIEIAIETVDAFRFACDVKCDRLTCAQGLREATCVHRDVKTFVGANRDPEPATIHRIDGRGRRMNHYTAPGECLSHNSQTSRPSNLQHLTCSNRSHFLRMMTATCSAAKCQRQGLLAMRGLHEGDCVVLFFLCWCSTGYGGLLCGPSFGLHGNWSIMTVIIGRRGALTH